MRPSISPLIPMRSLSAYIRSNSTSYLQHRSNTKFRLSSSTFFSEAGWRQSRFEKYSKLVAVSNKKNYIFCFNHFSFHFQTNLIKFINPRLSLTYAHLLYDDFWFGFFPLPTVPPSLQPITLRSITLEVYQKLN